MSKIKMTLLCLIMLLCFLVAGCIVQNKQSDTSPVDPGNNNGGDITRNIAVSATMFENCSIEFGTKTTSIGAMVDDGAQASESKSKNYLAYFDSDGNIDKVVFNREIHKGKNEDITYEQIDGSLKQMYVTKSFLFLAYTCEEKYSETIYSAHGFVNHQTRQSFTIDLRTGKVYSMEQFSGFSVECDNVIKASKADLGESYYLIEIKNEVLVVTDLLPNKNMTAKAIYSDAYGNIYVEIDKGFESRNGKIFYMKEFNYTKGSDGYFYQIRTPHYYSSGESYFGIDLYHLNKDGETVKSSNRSVQVYPEDYFGFSEWTKGYVFCDNFAYIIDRYRKEIDFYYTTEGYTFSNYMQYFPMPFSSMQFPNDYIQHPSIIELFYLNNHIILTAGADLVSMDSVFTLDLSKVTFNRHEFNLAYASVTLPPLNLLTQASEINETAMGLIASKDTATSHTQYMLYAAGKNISVKEVVSKQYDANVIFIQPLN